MSNADVLRAFVDGRRARSATLASESVAGGTVLYSYDTPVAYLADSTGTIDVDARKYSVTTSKQVGQAKRIAGAWREVPHEQFRRTVAVMGADLSRAR
jgi:hypothetical protein